MPAGRNDILKIHNILFGIALLPAAALLMKKHSVTHSDGRKEYLYTFGKKENGGTVIITNQTPSEVAKKAVKTCLKK